jgi:hypothetical protein
MIFDSRIEVDGPGRRKPFANERPRKVTDVLGVSLDFSNEILKLRAESLSSTIPEH